MILFDNVSKSFAKKSVLNSLSFTAHDGRVTGFVGPNGAGKSTSFKILLGLLPADGGRCVVDGRPYAEHQHPGAVLGAYLGAQHIPGGMTGRSFLNYTADLLGVPRASGHRYLESVGLSGHEDKKIEHYSLGMRQRLGVAAAFLGEPQHLVLDEPANGLDVSGVRWLRDYLKDAASAGRCVLLSSHLLSELEMVADDVVMLTGGRVSRSGALADLQSGTSDLVVVSSDDNMALAEHLKAAGYAVQITEDALHVAAVSINQVAEVVGRSPVPLRSLSRMTKRLEDVYLEQVKEGQ